MQVSVPYLRMLLNKNVSCPYKRRQDSGFAIVDFFLLLFLRPGFDRVALVGLEFVILLPQAARDGITHLGHHTQPHSEF